MTLVETVRLREILDSRGERTVEAEVVTETGATGRAAAPSGASTGAHEAIELPAADAIAAAREEAVPRLEGRIFAGDQRGVDRALVAADGTENFGRIGSNSAVAISMAASKAAAARLGIPLYQHLGGAFRGRNFPIPLGNVLGGGAHAALGPPIQEYLVAPVGAPSIADAVFANASVHAAVADEVAERDLRAAKGDEGAWAPPVDAETAFDIVGAAVDRVESEVGFDLRVGIDMAAAELYDPEADVYRFGDVDRTPAEHREYVTTLVDDYDLLYVEDPLDEDDFEGFAALTRALPDEVIVCGDDLFVTNVDRIERGVSDGAANAVLVKPNQIGTLSGAIDAIEAASHAGYEIVISHRSGETEDATIAHLAVATDAGFIKTGTVGGERTAKLNELIRIADNA